MELLPLAGLGGDGFGPGGTMVAGVGLVCGKLCAIMANVGTNKGGAIDYATLQKALRLNEICLQNKLPTINLVESAGANLPEQEKIFNYGGLNFREITRRSKEGIPSISVVFGNSTAGGAYIPGMSDYVIMVKNAAKVFLAGPPLVKMATNEVTDDESLGGAEIHRRQRLKHLCLMPKSYLVLFRQMCVNPLMRARLLPALWMVLNLLSLKKNTAQRW
jgi:acetyl-CoA carboxylase carboxyltransferase component